jgi:hypothetical protein
MSCGGRANSAYRIQTQDQRPPGAEIDPSSEPLVSGWAKLTVRVTMKLPLAPANRPVPSLRDDRPDLGRIRPLWQFTQGPFSVPVAYSPLRQRSIRAPEERR